MYAKQKCSSNFNICNVVRHANQNEGQEKGLAACNMYVTHGDGSGVYGLLEKNRRDIVGHIKYVTIVKTGGKKYCYDQRVLVKAI